MPATMKRTKTLRHSLFTVTTLAALLPPQASFAVSPIACPSETLQAQIAVRAAPTHFGLLAAVRQAAAPRQTVEPMRVEASKAPPGEPAHLSDAALRERIARYRVPAAGSFQHPRPPEVALSAASRPSCGDDR